MTAPCLEPDGVTVAALLLMLAGQLVGLASTVWLLLKWRRPRGLARS